MYHHSAAAKPRQPRTCGQGSRPGGGVSAQQRQEALSRLAGRAISYVRVGPNTRRISFFMVLLCA